MNTSFVMAFCLLASLLLHEGRTEPCKNCECTCNCPQTPCTCSSTCTETDCSISTTHSPETATSPLSIHVPATESQATSPETIIGAVLGGAVLGSALSVVVFMCMSRKLSVKKTKQTIFRKNNPVRKSMNGYQQKTLRDLNTNSAVYNEINDDLQRVVQPLQHQEAICSKDGVYNHLHTPDQEDKSDNYNHAGPTPSLPITDEGYGILTPSDSQSNENYSKIDPTTAPDNEEPNVTKCMETSKESNEYFTLEVNNK